MTDRVAIHLTRAAALVLTHWLYTVPQSAIPVTDPSERQALADLLAQLETRRWFAIGRGVEGCSKVAAGRCWRLSAPVPHLLARRRGLTHRPSRVTCNIVSMQRRKPDPVGHRVQSHRARLRSQGMRPIQIWVPDVRLPEFAAEAHRQSAAVAASRRSADDQAFIDAVSADED